MKGIPASVPMKEEVTALLREMPWGKGIAGPEAGGSFDRRPATSRKYRLRRRPVIFWVVETTVEGSGCEWAGGTAFLQYSEHHPFRVSGVRANRHTRSYQNVRTEWSRLSGTRA
jgi:hypothetical protein